MSKLQEAVSTVESKIRGKRIFKILGYVGLVISLLMQDVSVLSAGFLNIMLMVLLIDISGQAYGLVEDAAPEAPEAPAAE